VACSRLAFTFTFKALEKRLSREVNNRQLQNSFLHCCVWKILCSRLIRSTTTLCKSTIQSCFVVYTYEALFFLKCSSLHKVFFREVCHLTTLSFLRLYNICDELMIAEQWYKDANWGRQKYLYETRPISSFSTTEHTQTALLLNSGHRGNRPLACRLNHGTASAVRLRWHLHSTFSATVSCGPQAVTCTAGSG
jgi:hypothetical protein